jgi:hypothetical protein
VTDHPVLFYVFVLSNLAIAAAYLFVAVFVAPRIRLRARVTKVGGVGFFLLCRLMHALLAYYAFASVSHTTHSAGPEGMGLLMFLVHVLQAPAVWAFVVGLYVELGKFGGLDVRAPTAAAE